MITSLFAVSISEISISDKPLIFLDEDNHMLGERSGKKEMPVASENEIEL